MASVRLLAVAMAGLVLAGCNQPRPLYTLVKDPPPFRTQPNGQWLDNEDYAMDAQGFRIDKQGNRIGMVDIPGKTAGEQSNAMAGFYISSIGRNAPGSVMVPSEGAASGAGCYPRLGASARPSTSVSLAMRWSLSRMPAPDAARW